ncbi:MAG: hypothetical protein DBY41_10190 [Clostridium sp.]|nr:MAG: hypothetical protein DBY41_10190 [Clostridium sp.]
MLSLACNIAWGAWAIHRFAKATMSRQENDAVALMVPMVDRRAHAGVVGSNPVRYQELAAREPEGSRASCMFAAWVLFGCYGRERPFQAMRSARLLPTGCG